MKTLICYNCEIPIGEIDFDALIIRPLCGKCANPIPEGDNIRYTASHFKNNSPLKKPLMTKLVKCTNGF
ncbi:MAG: hypothetical protein OES14_05255 [Nitrosopumilus sp.]|nr:hypothetical protein [Nitrosopumilus sp.]MDH3825180.1 hypothetical protein [Nitrosopumilus sp.]